MNIEQERAQFEAWYRLHHGGLNVYGRDASGEYADKQVQGAFNVWQARAALIDLADDIRAAMQRATGREGEQFEGIDAIYGLAVVDKDEYRAVVAAMEQIDPATLPGLTVVQRCALGRFAKPAGGSAGDAQPVAWVAADTLHSPHPGCVSSLAYMSQLDRERGREYVPLYAAPVAAQAPFIEHETLRRALSHLGIAAPVSNEELGADMARYTRRVVEAAAQAPAAAGDARDAARYRWLRDPCSGAERVIFYCRGDYGRGLMSGSMLDAAIDAAMSKEGK